MLDVCFGDSECGTLKCGLKTTRVTFSYIGLEVGKISNESFETGRDEWVDDFFAICSKKQRNKIKQEQKERFGKIIETARSGESLRIWYASSPCSRCGFYHLIHSLNCIDCDISVIELPKDAGYKEDGDNSWGEINAWDIEKYLPLARKLEDSERQSIALSHL